MIKHELYFVETIDREFQWQIDLPFRLNIGDLIHVELLTEDGKIMDNEKSRDDYVDLYRIYEYFKVVYLKIDHRGYVCCGLIKG